MTKLGAAMAAAPSQAPATKASKLLSALAAGRVLRPITVPGFGLTALMTLVGAERVLEIEGELAAAMAKLGIPDTMENAGAWEIARSTRLLADAILDDDEKLRADPPQLGTFADWGRARREVIVELRRMYDELSEELDPAKDNSFTPEEASEIRLALAKKKPTLLRSFGAKRLTAFLLSLADQLESSPTLKSSPGDLSAES